MRNLKFANVRLTSLSAAAFAALLAAVACSGGPVGEPVADSSVIQ